MAYNRFEKGSQVFELPQAILSREGAAHLLTDGLLGIRLGFHDAIINEMAELVAR